MSNSAWSGARPHIDESELLCKTGCGYYGNPVWNGHCSKCYKELGQKKSIKKGVFDPIEIKNKVSRSVSDVSDFPYKASNIVSKKLDKRTKAVKSIFKKTHSSKGEKEVKVGRQLSEESGSVMAEFESFFKTVSKDAEQLLRKHLVTFMDKNSKIIDQLSLDEMGELIHEFYSSIHDLTINNQAFSDFTQEQVEAVSELTERYVTTRLYKGLIREVNALSEEKDLVIQERIRNLNWISTTHLECKVNEKNPEARTILDCVISDLIEIDSKRVPSDKLRLLVSASHQVLNLLSKSSGGSPVSADDFLPALIFCVIRANPPLLQSNITYVTNFALQSSLQSGEAGYFFTNLCCAVSFIEKLTADSLGLTTAEFNRFMSGDALSLNALDPDYMSEGMRLMHRNIEVLCEIESHLNMVLDGYDSIVHDLEEFEAGFVGEINSVMENTRLEIRSRKANIDDSDPSQELLPPPLTPQNMKSFEGMTDAPDSSLLNVRDSCENQSKDISSDFDLKDHQKLTTEEVDNSSFLSDEISYSNKPAHRQPLEAGLSLPSDFRKDIISSDMNYPLHSSSLSHEQQLDDEPLSIQDYTLKPVEGIFEPHRIKWPQHFNAAVPYTAFSVQGVNIPSIPCDTAMSHAVPDSFSLHTKSSHYLSSVPLIPDNISSHSTNVGNDKAVRNLEEETIDNLL